MFSSACVLAIALTLRAAAPMPPPAPADRPLAHLLPNLAHDLRAVPSGRTALIAAAGSAAAAATHATADERMADWATARGESGYGTIGGIIGNGWMQGSAAVATYAVGRVNRSPRVTETGSDLIRAQLLNGVLTWGLKIAVTRGRPDGGTRSFPSGHTSAAFASASVLDGIVGWHLGLPAYAVASFIGWTRVRDDQHWLSDVVAGAAIGTIAGRTVMYDDRHATWHITPIVGQEIGIVVTRTGKSE